MYLLEPQTSGPGPSRPQERVQPGLRALRGAQRGSPASLTLLLSAVSSSSSQPLALSTSPASSRKHGCQQPPGPLDVKTAGLS